MRRWFLLTLGGLGASAAAVVLLPGTAHALSPAKAGPIPVPVVAPAPVPTVLPPTVLPTLPRVASPTPVVVAKKVVTRVVDRVRTAIPPIAVHAPVALPFVTVEPAAATHAAHSSSTHAPLAARARVADTSMFDADPSATSSSHATMTATRPSPRSRSGAALAGLLVPSTGNAALTTAKPSFSPPFVYGDTRTFAPGVVSTRVSSPTGDRTRPGFLVGSARPG